ncbi:MAG: fused MFS/spermidine synthase [Candidatus Krumholzibacteriia bacterium]
MTPSLAHLLFFLSGFAGLAYEIAWIRRSALTFGATVEAVSAVLAVFFGGLALGSWLFARIGQATRRPLRVYGFVEIGVAVTAVTATMLFGAAEAIYGAAYRAVGGDQFALFGIRLLLLGFLLLPPTILMGGTLPLFCRQFVRHKDRIANSVGILYGLNTLGAAAGAAATGFWLLPHLGILGSVLLAAAVNVAVGLAAIGLRPEHLDGTTSRRDAAPAENETAARSVMGHELPPRAPLASPPHRRRLALAGALFFLTGLTALGSEVLWTRFLALVFRNSVHTYTIALTVVLVGIVMGSAVAARLGDRRLPLGLLFGVLQAAAALSVLVLLQRPATFWLGLGEGVAPYLVLLLPPAVLSGALFPVAARMVLEQPDLAASRIGRLAALNTAGGIVGALLTGFLLLPRLGLETALLVTTGIGVSAAVAALLLWPGPVRLPARLAVAAAAVTAWLIVPAAADVDLPADFLRGRGRLIDHCEGRTSTLAVLRVDETRELQIDRHWQGSDRKNHQIMAAHVPMLLHSGAREVLVIGTGVGQTAGRFLLHDVDRVDCVDIEPALFAFVRRHFPSAWMDDPRVRLVTDDGRDFLVHGRGEYDVISIEVGQIFRSGVESFYTREFYGRARERLRPDGVVSQFVPLAFLGPEELRRLVATFLDVFPGSVLWYNTSELLLVGGPAGVRLEAASLDRLREPRLAQDLKYSAWGGHEFHLNRPGAFLGGFFCGPQELARLAAGADVYRDDRPALSYAAARVRPEDRREIELARLLSDHLGAVESIVAGSVDRVALGAAARVQRWNLRDLVAGAHLRRASELHGLQDPAAALKEIRRAREANPHSLPARRMEGFALLQAGQIAAAGAAFRDCLAMDADCAASRRGLGLVLYNQRNLPAAVAHLERAVALHSRDAAAHNALGAALAGLQRHAEAAHHFRTALSLDPQDQAAQANLQRVSATLSGARGF